MARMRLRGFAALALLFTGPTVALGQPSNGYGWVTIDHAGNRAATAEESWFGLGAGLGRVDHNFRMSQTETTNTQWLEFLNAYQPFYHGDGRTDMGLTGRWIDLGSDNRFQIAQYAENLPVGASWRNMARYCNWLTNGKVSTAASFETGAYDASTFTTNPDGSYNDAMTHLPDATYWMPSIDEWAKAAYYDQNRYGQGAEGYWLYPNATNIPLISGLPWAGGQTSAGTGIPEEYGGLAVGLYGAVGPWSVCDMSGGEPEWTETTVGGLYGNGYRHQKGSRFGELFWTNIDALQYDTTFEGVDFAPGGLRLVTAIPSPPSVLFFVTGLFAGHRRSRIRSPSRLP